MRALNSVPEKDAEIKKVVDALEPELEDHLMKYIYRILGDAESCGAMLKWHKVLFTKSGLGCIVRAITDRKSV
jgi:actin related protein 2/3 complex, subunit 5|tara:strand:+ start:450 stop:668 length:219 start_codon:yes stop_codon:yes gene_type:complete